MLVFGFGTVVDEKMGTDPILQKLFTEMIVASI